MADMEEIRKSVEGRRVKPTDGAGEANELSKGAISPQEEEVGVPVEEVEEYDIPDTRMPGILRELAKRGMSKSLDDRMDDVSRAVSKRRAERE